MPRVNINLNGRSYVVACEEGQESRLRQLAGFLDSQLKAIAARASAASEAQLLVLASLTIIDQLFDLKEEVQALSNQRGAAPAQAQENGEEKVVIAAVDLLAKRIEDIAAKLERA